MNLRPYRKLIAALIGVGLLLAFRHFDLPVNELTSFVVDLLIGAGTAFGVYQTPNEPLS